MTTLTFAVRRQDPELIGPAAPTPRETKCLSDIDGQGTRMHARTAFFYSGGRRGTDDPAAVIRRALSEALVPYYPLAGRLREVAGKLVVDCTGEGVLFVEADADVRLAELEAETGGVREPVLCMDELFDVESSSGFVNCPVMLIQVTRLLCGGFVFALRSDHAMCDATGLAQFLSAVAEHARGLPAPTTAPAWSRELLDARSPPRPALPNPAYDPVAPAAVEEPPASGGGGRDMVSRAFTFTRAHIAAIKQGLPTHLRDKATAFDAVAAAIWRSRAVALDPRPGDDMPLGFIVDVRRFRELGLPAGYYGNAIVFVMAMATAGALRGGSLVDAVELVREAKALVTAEYVRSVADLLLVQRHRPRVSPPAKAANSNLLIVSDCRHAGFHTVDFGWGEPVYGGSMHNNVHQPISAVFSAVKNGDGEDVLVVPLTLPQPAMDRFASEIEMLLKGAYPAS